MEEHQLTLEAISGLMPAIGKLVKLLWTVLVAVAVCAFGAGQALMAENNRLNNLESYGSKSLQQHERQQREDTLSQVKAMTALETTVKDLGEQVRGLAEEVRKLRQGK